MYEIWGGESGLNNIWKYFTWKVAIDNWVFRLHYIATTLIFTGYSILVTISTYAGDPIDCVHSAIEDWGEKFLDSYCFIHGTQTIGYPRAGSMSSVLECGSPHSDCVETHSYYMWVPLVVLLQAGLSYSPHYLWYGWEGGRMDGLLETLMEVPAFLTPTSSKDQGGCSPSTDSEGRSAALTLAKQFRADVGHNLLYAGKHAVGEWLCLGVSCLQIVITDRFLGENFVTYGQQVLDDLSYDGADPSEGPGHMERIFPIVTACSIEKYGSGGDLERTNAVCVLPNNMVHQKFYLFLWFWLLFLTLATFLLVTYRTCLLLLPHFRLWVTTTCWTGIDVIAGGPLEREVAGLVASLGYSDWIVLSLFHTNLTTLHFHSFLQHLLGENKKRPLQDF